MKEHLKTITTKEAKLILGRPTRTVSRWMKSLREHYKKKKGTPVTRLEFCQYFKYNIDDIIQVIKQMYKTA